MRRNAGSASSAYGSPLQQRELELPVDSQMKPLLLTSNPVVTPPVHAHGHAVARRDAQAFEHLRAALPWRGPVAHLLRRGPFDGDRIGAHQRAAPAEPHGALLAVDARLEVAVDGVDEVVAVELGVEAHDAGAQQAAQQLGVPGADAQALGVREGDVPEGQHRGVRQPRADLARRTGGSILPARQTKHPPGGGAELGSCLGPLRVPQEAGALVSGSGATLGVANGLGAP